MKNADYHEGYVAALQDCIRASTTLAKSMEPEQAQVALGLAEAFQNLATELGEPSRIVIAR